MVGIRGLSAVLAATIGVTVAVTAPEAASAQNASLAVEDTLPGAQVWPTVAAQPVPAVTVTSPRIAAPRSRPAPRWPSKARGSGAVAATGIAGIKGTLVSVGRVAGTSTGPRGVVGQERMTPQSSPSSVVVDQLSAEAARLAGGHGLLFTVADADGGVGGRLRVEADISGFATAFGGDFASRLQLVRIPECVVLSVREGMTPTKACQDIDPVTVSSRLDVSRGALTAEIDLGAALSGRLEVAESSSPSGATALMVTSGAGGSAGTYSATPTTVASTWQVGTGTGNFGWNYPLATAATLTGTTPELSLAYSSQSVDGMTSGDNTQAPATGVGWDLGVPYIERLYGTCTAIGTDRCWVGDRVRLSLNGKSGFLVKDTNAAAPAGVIAVYRLQDDPGWRVHLERNGSNDDHFNERWTVIDPHGVAYAFGRGFTTSGTGSVEPTNSVLTVPVVSDNPGEPCYTGSYESGMCRRGWRWNLDWVVDPNGNQQSYVYKAETNYYQFANNPSRIEPYQRGAVLARIDYGFRWGETARSRVVVGSEPRCTERTSDIGGGFPTTAHTCAAWGAANQDSYPDVPMDLLCSASSCSRHEPTFFTGYLVRSVTAQVHSGTGWVSVSNDTLAYNMVDSGETGTDPVLWLTRIVRTGTAGGSVKLPTVAFWPVSLENRVDHNVSAGVVRLMKPRVGRIDGVFGGSTLISYGHPSGQACSVGSLPADWDQNTKDCFRKLWKPPGSSTGVGIFHKYLTMSVNETNPFPVGTSTASADRMTKYTYTGGGAWHRGDTRDPGSDPTLPDSAYSPQYAEWRGYGRMDATSWTDSAYRSTLAGSTVAAKPVAMTRYVLFRGMHGDRLLNGTTRSVSVTDLHGGVLQDTAYLAGRVREKATMYLSSAGNVVDEGLSTRYQYTSARTVQQNPSGAADPLLDAHRVVEMARIERRMELPDIADPPGTAAGGTSIWVWSTYDSLGRRIQERRQGPNSTYDRCTVTKYAGAAGDVESNKIEYPAEVSDWGSDCANGSFGSATALAMTRYIYDGASSSFGQPVGRGTPTTVYRLKSSTNPVPGNVPSAVWLSTSAQFDAYGRPQSSTDAKGKVTQTAYSTPTSAAQSVTVTNPLGHETTTVLHRSLLQPLTVTDANGLATISGYDGLGRLTSVRLPGQASNAPGYKFGYSFATGTPTRVTSSALLPNGQYRTTTQFLDALGQVRQVQSPSPLNLAGGLIAVNTRVDEKGRIEATSQPFYVGATSGQQMWAAPMDNAGYNEDRTDYDWASRPVVNSHYAPAQSASPLWTTTRYYYGKSTLTAPPTGAAVRFEKFDAVGRVVYVREGVGSLTATTTTTYDKADRTASITDAGNHTAAHTYDLLGRRISTDDPDAHTTTTDFDNNDNPTRITKSTTEAVDITYDDLNRPTTWQGRTSPTAAWTTLQTQTYDTATLGVGRPGITTVLTPGGNNYTQGVTSYTSHGLPAALTYTAPPVSGKATSTTLSSNLGYTIADQPKTQTYAGVGAGLVAETVTTAYDSAGLADTLTGAAPYVSDTSYSAIGDLSTRYLGDTTAAAPTTSEVHRIYYWDANTLRLKRVLTSSHGGAGVFLPRQDDEYTYDPAGQPISVTHTQSATRTCYSYDVLTRLRHAWTTAATGCNDAENTSAGPAPFNTRWNYTSDGNITSVTRQGVTSSYTYGDPLHPHAATSSGSGTSYTYRANGDMSGRTTPATGATTLAFDLLGKLRSQTSASGTTTFVHTADGSRLSRTTPDGTTTLYAFGQEIDIKAGVHVAGRRYYAINGTTVAVRSTTATTNTLTWQLNDTQASAQLQIDDASHTINRLYTDPFGVPRTGSASPITDRSWLGKTKDAETGLTHLGARYYDTSLGRFLTTDPLNDQRTTQTPNPYTYAGNNPVSYADPTGLMLGGMENGGATVDEHDDPVADPCRGNPGCGLDNPDANPRDLLGDQNAGEESRRQERLTEAKPPMLVELQRVYQATRHLLPVQSQAIGDVVVDTASDISGCFGARDTQSCMWISVSFFPSGRLIRSAKAFATAAKSVDVPKVNWGHQEKHFPGHPNFQVGRSTMTADPERLLQRAGTGEPVGKVTRGQPGFRERVDFGETIGTWVSRDGTAADTSVGIIHYRMDGTAHIVPATPR